MADIYNVDDVIEKTLFARVKVPVYESVPPYIVPGGTNKLLGYVLPGNPVGIVQSYLAADPTRGRNNLWWMFYPASSMSTNYYVESVPGYFDVESLREQGVISTEEQIEKEETENLPWYEQLLTKYGKPIFIGVTITALAAAAIKGYFSRPKSNT